MEDNFFDKSPEKTTGFYFAIVFLVIFSLLSVGIDITEYLNRQDINIPL